ncbi:MAG: hypothetical protein CMD33_09000 [Flavobacteriales bacterium]|nr:hypothetical protein [Flavobacteriales bacterium]
MLSKESIRKFEQKNGRSVALRRQFNRQQLMLHGGEKRGASSESQASSSKRQKRSMTKKQAVEAFQDIFDNDLNDQLRPLLENGGVEFINSKYHITDLVSGSSIHGTALHHAVTKKNAQGVRTLLEFGADVNALASYTAHSPMEMSWDCDPEIFTILSESGGTFDRDPVDYLNWCSNGVVYHGDMTRAMVKHGITFTYENVKDALHDEDIDDVYKFYIVSAILDHVRLTKEQAQHLISLTITYWRAFTHEHFQHFISQLLLHGKTVVRSDHVTHGEMVNEFPYTDVLKKFQDPFEVILANVFLDDLLREYIDFHDEHGWKITKEMIERVEALTENYLQEEKMEVANYLRMKRRERALQFNDALVEMRLHELPDEVKRKMFNEY